MNVLLTPGDHVIATFPGYQSLYEVAGALGATVTRWALKPSAAGWQLDLAALERSITPAHPAAGDQLPAQPHRPSANRSGAGRDHRAGTAPQSPRLLG